MSKEPPPAGSQAEEALLAPVVLTAAQAAQMLQVSAQLIVRWARDGHLRVFVPPGGDLLGGHRGPKTYRFGV